MTASTRKFRKAEIGDSAFSFSSVAMFLVVFTALVVLMIMGVMALMNNAEAVTLLADMLKVCGVGVAVLLLPLLVTGLGASAE